MYVIVNAIFSMSSLNWQVNSSSRRKLAWTISWVDFIDKDPSKLLYILNCITSIPAILWDSQFVLLESTLVFQLLGDIETVYVQSVHIAHYNGHSKNANAK